MAIIATITTITVTATLGHLTCQYHLILYHSHHLSCPYFFVFILILLRTALVPYYYTHPCCHTHAPPPSAFTLDTSLAINLTTTVTYTPYPALTLAPLNITTPTKSPSAPPISLIHTEYHDPRCRTTPHPRPLTLSPVLTFAFLSSNDWMTKPYPLSAA